MISGKFAKDCVVWIEVAEGCALHIFAARVNVLENLFVPATLGIMNVPAASVMTTTGIV